MKKIFAQALLPALVMLMAAGAPTQQIPFLSELFSRYEEFNRLYHEKRGANLPALETLRKRGEEAFRRGNIPGILEVISEGSALLQGKQWDERQKFLASLTVETDRLVIEPNQDLQVSLTRMYPADMEKAFPAPPTVSFEVVPAPRATGGASPAPSPAKPAVIAQKLAIAESSSNAARRLLLAEGVYWVVARIEAGGQVVAEIKRPVYAITDFGGGVKALGKMVADIKASADPKVKAVAQLVATPEFQLQRLSSLNSARGEDNLDPIRELSSIESSLSALAKGQNPFERERGELERAYQGSDGKLIPYRVYVPQSYDGANPRPLVVMLHGALGDERYYFSGLFDPAVIKGEAERRGYVLVGVNGRGRFGGYRGLAVEDTYDVIKSVSRDYKIDASRIYLTGHSMGGYGAWLVAAERPEVFAALAPVSGGPPAQGEALAALLQKVKGIPAMVAHGARDGIVTPEQSRDIASAAQKAGMKVSYVEIPEADHLTVVAATFPAILDFFDKNAKPAPAK
ncbi:MAG TPA: prolyl oligopeptidase family serine peptidase [Blastocatellia bacterium]|jgi:pimeloyl-ACP methyl ester carboxylesterase|nr:prolyl oligopeptidase family serine peptidase [Blastocatellia bacterium]